MISLNSNQWLYDCGSNKENSLIYKQNAIVLWCKPEVNSTIGKSRYHHKNYYKVILLHYHSKLSLMTLTDRGLSPVTWIPKNVKSLTTTHLEKMLRSVPKKLTVNHMYWCDAVVLKIPIMALIMMLCFVRESTKHGITGSAWVWVRLFMKSDDPYICPNCVIIKQS